MAGVALPRGLAPRSPFVDSVASPPNRRTLEIGFAIVIVAVPVAFFPLARAPFVDPKLPVVLLGTLAVWAARPRIDLRFAAAAAAWILALSLAGIFGVDPWMSFLGPDDGATGTVLLGSCAFLLVAGASAPPDVVERLPVWFVATGVAISLVAVAYRLAPGAFDAVIPDLSFRGSTVGQVGFLSGLAAACVSAVVALKNLNRLRLFLVVAILASSLAVAAERSGWIAAALGLAFALHRAELARARKVLIVGTFLLTLAAWTVGDAVFHPAGGVSAASRFAEINTGSALARVHVLEAAARAWTERPLLGWGPGNTWSAYMSATTPEHIEVAGRGWRDAHNLAAESLVTTGLLGFSILAVLVVLLALGILRAPPRLAWALGAVVALAVHHLLQPQSVAITPILFLFAGVAAQRGSGSLRRPLGRSGRPLERLRRFSRLLVGVLIAAGLVLSTLGFSASVLEQWGRKYNSNWSLGAALRFAPGRVSTAGALVISLAVDGRSGDEEAAREARELAHQMVANHPWHPDVRLIASDVHRLLRDESGAREWARRQLIAFPADTRLVGTA